jgi:hypothetical protein
MLSSTSAVSDNSLLVWLSQAAMQAAAVLCQALASQALTLGCWQALSCLLTCAGITHAQRCFLKL